MVATDTKNNSNTTSWNSKISTSTIEADSLSYNERGKHAKNYNRRFSNNKSTGTCSIMSTDSDIRFTRKFSYQYRSGCCILATILITILSACILLYLGYRYFKIEPGGEQQFRGMFTVISNDTYEKQLSDMSSNTFKIHASQYIKSLNDIFDETRYRFSYIGAEILAFDGENGGNLTVFFGLKFNPRWQNIRAQDLKSILKVPTIANRTIDTSSVFVEESMKLNEKSNKSQPMPSTSEAISNTNFFDGNQPLRQCVQIQLSHCLGVSKYNYTTYPNIFGHNNIDDVKNDLISFRELIDAECYQHALEFVCHVLQPVCEPTNSPELRANMFLPCKSFCLKFWSGCGDRIPTRLRQMLDCSRFPDNSNFGNGCTDKYDCKAELMAKGQSGRICDGIIDCADMTDEKICPYCPPDHIHCGIGKYCINSSNYCNGISECPDNSDERNCLSLIPNISSARKLESTHSSYTFSEGYVTVMEKGVTSKICAENVASILNIDNHLQRSLNGIANSLCQRLTYEKSVYIKPVKDGKESDIDDRYVEIEDPYASEEASFVFTNCSSREVLYAQCTNIDCGKQVTRNHLKGLENLSKMSMPGDWPWHVALLKDGVHVCDGTLVSSEWILTTVSCFQGQSRSEWIARFGTVRLTSKSPWQQERHIIGMVKSPVEGSTLVMIKLNDPVLFSDFVRPVCLPAHNFSIEHARNCNTLGWTKNRETLQRIEVEESNMESCADISITSVNGLCADAVYGGNNCDEEELAGSPMVCLNPDDETSWTLVGVSNWRIACSMIGTQRPRLYDKTTSNIKWIRNTIFGM